MCECSQEPDETLFARSILRDLTNCSDFGHFSDALGFVPASPEVDYAEHVQSHMRCQALEPISHLIEKLGTSAGNVIAAVAEHTGGDMPDGAHEVYANVSHVASYAVIAQLVDYGLLEVRR